MKKSVLGSILKSVTFVVLFSASFSVFGQTCSSAKCFATAKWTQQTYYRNQEVQYQVSKSPVRYNIYKCVQPSTTAKPEASNRCDYTGGVCNRYWQLVCKTCTNLSARMETGEEGSFSEESEMESNNLAYPNPFTSNLNVRASVNASSAEVSIMNLIGERVLTNNVATENGKVNTTFDTGNLASGMYIVQITAGEEVITYKVSK